jgi:cytochrome d ubiquinol oxidase subunit I
LSLLAFHDAGAEVKGLSAFPRADRPDPLPVHIAFQFMTACGCTLAVVSLFAAGFALRGRGKLFRPGFLRSVVFCGPLGILAVEAGWTVTELGRQPWAIRGVLRTADAATPVGGLLLPFAFFSALYLALAVSAAWLLRREVAQSPSFPVGRDAGGAPKG